MPKVPVNPFRGVLLEANMLDADIATNTTSFVEVGRYTVPAGVGVSLGYGPQSGQDSAAGRIYCDLNAAGPVDVDGVVRLVAIDPREMVVETLFECHTSQLRTSATDRQQQLPFPEHAVILTEDYVLSFQIRGDAVATIDVSICDLCMDITTYTMR